MKIYKSYNIKDILKLMLFFIILSILLIFSKDNFKSVTSSINIFISSIIPSLFPFIFFTEFMLSTDILNLLKDVTGKLLSKVFKISKTSAPAIITGFLCGFPMGAKTVATLYENNSISKKEASKLLCFVNNCNPVFILSTIGIGILHNLKLGIILCISHYLSSILIGIIFFRKSSINIIHEKGLKLNSLDKNNYITDESIFEITKKCIKNTFSTLLMILGFMIIFNLCFTILEKILIILNVNQNVLGIVSGIFEVTSGINNIFNLEITSNYKILTISFLLGFSGLCIISQIYSTISKYSFSFIKLLFWKLIHGIISVIFTYIAIKYTNISINNVTEVYNSADDTLREYYMLNMKYSYLLSTGIILLFLYIYYLTKKVAYKK